MQLERIAKLNVQYERIQNTIDAQFQISRATSSIYDTLFKTLDIDQKTAGLIADAMFGMGNSDEFLDKTPTLCQYLHHVAGK